MQTGLVRRSEKARRPVAIQRKLTSNRLAVEPELVKVEAGGSTVKKNDSGTHVTRIQQALADLKYDVVVTGTFDDTTMKAVRDFQSDNELTPTESVDAATISRIDAFLAQHMPERMAAIEGPGSGTRSLSSQDVEAVKAAISTEIQADPMTGKVPDFKEKIGDQKYGDRLKARAETVLLWQWESLGKGKADARKDAENLHPWKSIAAVAVQSKAATDNVFSKYKTGPPLKPGVSIHDGWEYKAKLFKKTPAVKEEAAKWRVRKIVQGDREIAKINQEHNAVQSRDKEKAIIDRVSTELVATHKTKLLETHMGWPGFAAGGEVYLQRFKGGDDKTAHRSFMWDKFFTIIHEYLHTLEHPKHKAHSASLGDKEGGKTLREGVVEYCTHTVIDHLGEPGDEVRKKVEGAHHEVGVTHPIPPYHGYAERKNAENMAGIVGAKNVFAAFFLGEIDKIGAK